jgi:GntR family transcriptional repressor for pyruvate dehydrogenase complex
VDELLSRLVDVILTSAADSSGPGPVRLPPEREIAQMLGVQRSTLREALATLTHLGILHRTQGRGTYVGLLRSDFVQLYFNIALAVGQISIEDLETLREMLEREIARRAALTATPRDVFELEELARRLESSHSVSERLEIEYEFHRCLARTTKSPVIELLTDGLASVLRRILANRVHAVQSIAGSAKLMDAAHMPIALAIGRRDPDAAVAAMDAHFAVFSELSAKLIAKQSRRNGRPKRATKMS